MSGQFEGGQFSSFDGLDNRKAVMDLFVRLGDNVSYQLGSDRRAAFLQGLLRSRARTFQGVPFEVHPCTAVEAYHLFVAVTGVLGVPIETAAKLLEDHVRMVAS